MEITNQVTKLDPRVIVKKENPRGEIDNLHVSELKNSIRKQGVINPITVNKTSNGVYELVSGYHRLTTVLQLIDEGWNEDYEIPCFVKELSPEEAAIEAYLSNEAKSNTLVALGNTILTLRKYGFQDDEISKRIGVPLNKVRRAIVVIEAPERLLNMVKNNVLSETQLYELILRNEYDYDLVEQTIKEALPYAGKRGKVTKSVLEKRNGVRENPMILLEKYIKVGESDQFDQSASNIQEELRFLVNLQEALERNINAEDYWYNLTGIRFTKKMKEEVINTTSKKRGRPRKNTF